MRPLTMKKPGGMVHKKIAVVGMEATLMEEKRRLTTSNECSYPHSKYQCPESEAVGEALNKWSDENKFMINTSIQIHLDNLII